MIYRRPEKAQADLRHSYRIAAPAVLKALRKLYPQTKKAPCLTSQVVHLKPTPPTRSPNHACSYNLDHLIYQSINQPTHLCTNQLIILLLLLFFLKYINRAQ